MKMRILISAAKIRIRQGMALEDILSGWPNLTEEEKEKVREAVQ